MTDQTVPNVTDDDRKLAREWAEGIEANPKSWSLLTHTAARVLQALLPSPPRPTLANMTPKERVACRWMQCDVANVEARAVIVNPNEEDGKARVVWPGGFNKPIDWEEVTPRRDVPCMEWPSDQKPAPALPGDWRLAEHPQYGRVVVTSTEPDPSGHVYFVGPADDSMGCDRFFCDPARLTYIDQGADQ